MRKVNNKPKGRELLRRVRKQRLRYITLLPSLVTITNGLCGFLAIGFAAKGTQEHVGSLSFFAIAGYLILLAMIADMLDGRLARISQSTSSFGGQLDSLCDVISFGVAPAFLMLRLLETQLVLSGFGRAEFLQRFIWLAAAAYMSCAAIRLARFNVENEEDESAHMSFVGLPTPAAAGVIVSLVIFHQETLPQWGFVVYLLPAAALVVAGLMVSRIQYPHVLNQYLRGKKPFAYLIRSLLLLGLVIWSRQAALVVIFWGFAASSAVKWFYRRMLHRPVHILKPVVEQLPPEQQQT